MPLSSSSLLLPTRSAQHLLEALALISRHIHSNPNPTLSDAASALPQPATPPLTPPASESASAVTAALRPRDPFTHATRSPLAPMYPAGITLVLDASAMLETEPAAVRKLIGLLAQGRRLAATHGSSGAAETPAQTHGSGLGAVATHGSGTGTVTTHGSAAALAGTAWSMRMRAADIALVLDRGSAELKRVVQLALGQQGPPGPGQGTWSGAGQQQQPAVAGGHSGGEDQYRVLMQLAAAEESGALAAAAPGGGGDADGGTLAARGSGSGSAAGGGGEESKAPQALRDATKLLYVSRPCRLVVAVYADSQASVLTGLARKGKDVLAGCVTEVVAFLELLLPPP